jgi:glutamate N-acetyltransferase/amino-acid N-acetyltransferase
MIAREAGTFASRDAHRAWLAAQAALPRGFRVGVHRFAFTPAEVAKPAQMTATLIALDQPTDAFAALFTKNALPGAPVIIGRQRLQEPTLAAVVINNKVSNVCAHDGVASSEAVCAAAASALGIAARQVLPCSTGVIGWRLPLEPLCAAVGAAARALAAGSAMPAAEGIMTTDLYPKVRRRDLLGGSIIGFAKGAGMIEPNLATMLVYLLTDLAVPRARLREALAAACRTTFNCMSIDSDTSTSDTVLALSSQRVPVTDHAAFAAALTAVCAELSEDIARNGEGVHHVVRVQVRGAHDAELARAVGKSVVNSPLLQCAICGNDPNVGRLVMAIGKEVGARGLAIDPGRMTLRMGGRTIFAHGAFTLDHDTEAALKEHLRAAELYASAPPQGCVFTPPVDFPPHARRVEIEVELGAGACEATVVGTDRSHEYISENADYRS